MKVFSYICSNGTEGIVEAFDKYSALEQLRTLYNIDVSEIKEIE